MKYLLPFFVSLAILGCGSSSDEPKPVLESPCTIFDYRQSQITDITSDGAGFYYSINDSVMFVPNTDNFNVSSPIASTINGQNGFIGLNLLALDDGKIITASGDVISNGVKVDAAFSNEVLLVLGHGSPSRIAIQDDQGRLDIYSSPNNIVNSISSSIQNDADLTSIIGIAGVSPNELDILYSSSDSSMTLARYDIGLPFTILFENLIGFKRVVGINEMTILLSSQKMRVISETNSTILYDFTFPDLTYVAIDGDTIIAANNAENYRFNTVSEELSTFEFGPAMGGISAIHNKDGIKYIGTSLGLWKLENSQLERLIDNSDRVRCLNG